MLGLRGNDRRHAKVQHVLRLNAEGSLSATVLSSAVMEVRAVLYSRGLPPEAVEEAFSLMDAILASNDVNTTAPVHLADVVVADRMRNQEPSLGFFDSLHAAASKRLGKVILSSEGIYRRIGLPTLDLDKF